MNRGFYIIMAAQFFSALADNALLIAAISMLRDIQSPAQYEPLLKLFFTVSYVALAAFVGAFADSMAKGRVMLISNTIKIAGCFMMLVATVPMLDVLGIPLYYYVLLSYAIVGLGAAAYSPAKYGILTEYLPHDKLVIANGWIEGLTVAAIILGTVLGGVLINPTVSAHLMAIDLPAIETSIDTPAEVAMLVISLLYLVAALFNLFIPDTGVDHKPLHRNPVYLMHEFWHCVRLLWRDKLGQISLAVTTLFWGAGATLQFIVLKWADRALGLPLDKATVLQGVVALGIAVGAVIAAKAVSLDKSVKVLPVGITMGIVVMGMIFVTGLPVALVMMVAVGAMAGFFVVPMNALLQHRGHILMGAGHSIAVQNFNENTSILAMLGLYALLVYLDLSIYVVIVIFGVFVSLTMFLVGIWHRRNMREHGEELQQLLAAAKNINAHH
ncbi:MAG: lysophospholipid transporter LplT [Rhodocyclales bacterium]|jgi:MFS family permease|nr:lysophospholipid transporter LplT [Rhodocyclales bacterium]CAG0956448.1 Lysophospholipid transporter LplT [Rhodocyclaceae bacterium]